VQAIVHSVDSLQTSAITEHSTTMHTRRFFLSFFGVHTKHALQCTTSVQSELTRRKASYNDTQTPRP